MWERTEVGGTRGSRSGGKTSESLTTDSPLYLVLVRGPETFPDDGLSGTTVVSLSLRVSTPQKSGADGSTGGDTESLEWKSRDASST